jgi:hypothetical protein
VCTGVSVNLIPEDKLKKELPNKDRILWAKNE